MGLWRKRIASLFNRRSGRHRKTRRITNDSEMVTRGLIVMLCIIILLCLAGVLLHNTSCSSDGDGNHHYAVE